MKISKEEASGAIEEGVYVARVSSIEEKEGRWGTFLSWAFQIDDPESEHDGRVILGMTPSRWAEGEKTDRWLQAFGISANVGDEFDLDELVGKRVQIMVQNRTQGDREFSNVISLKPLTKKRDVAATDKPLPRKPPETAHKHKQPDDDFSFD